MAKPDQLEGLIRTFLIAGLVLLAVILLVYGSGILIPLAIALLIWFLINAIASGFQRISFGAFRIPRSVALSLAMAAIVIAGENIVPLDRR